MNKISIGLIVLLLLHLLVLVNIQFTAWPEMLSFPYMVNKGFVIYKDFHHAYQPLLTIFLSFFFKVFGFKLIALKILTLTIILINDFLIFLLSVKLFGKKMASLIPLAIYVLLQPVLEGNMLWFDLATAPFLLSSIYFALKFFLDKRSSLLWSGLFLAIAILIKQQSILFLAAYFVFFWVSKVKTKDFLKFSVGGLIPVLLTFSAVTMVGVFKDYIFWTLKFPLLFLPKIPGYGIFPTTSQLVTLVGFSFPLLSVFSRKIVREKTILFLALVLACGFLAAFPRFSFFHLQTVLPIYAILLVFLSQKLDKSYLVLLPVLISLFLWSRNISLFGLADRFYDEEAKRMASFLASNSEDADSVYLLGPHGLIYVLADRIPPKPWIENYVWHFEIPGVVDAELKTFEENPPKVILWSEPESGLWYKPGVYQPEKITQWIKDNYVREKNVDGKTFLWRMK